LQKAQPAARAGLDETDLAILRALARDAHLTNKALSTRLGLAECTCAYLTCVPGVLQALHVAGEDDFHLHVAAESPQALRDLVLEHITVHRVVRQTQTQLVFEARDGAGVLARLT